MQQARPIRWFRRLRWKLSLLYTLVTSALIFIGMGVGEVIAYYRHQSIHQPQMLVRDLAEDAGQIAPYLSSVPANTDALSLWLKTRNEKLLGVPNEGPSGLAFYGNPVIYTAVTNGEGVVVASQTNQSASVTPPLPKKLVTAALQGKTRPEDLSAIESEDILMAAAPIFDDKQRVVVGALFTRLQAPFDWRVHLQKLATDLIKPLLTMIVLALIGGIGFGLVTAHSLTTRLAAISKVAGAWGRGDFSVTADDRATDEIGQLAHRLNFMANELQGVLTLRQELATMGERHRLARDLHDTVKQQIFALSMQIGAAQAMLNGAAPEIQNRLSEAENLVRQVQHELVTIIKELQVTGSTEKDFETVLQDHVNDWSRQSGIAAKINCDSALSLPSSVEQAFFRIVQEALANVARHSRATQVSVQITHAANNRVMLFITDNGEGFSPGRDRDGMGLRNMRERAEALPGGVFKLESKKDKGTQITAIYDAKATQ